MAAANLLESRIQLVYDYGVDGNGKPVFKTKSYSNLKVSATADQIFNASQALASLSSVPLFAIERNDTTDITA